MNILITGAYGFVGTNISSYLSGKDHSLIALDQTSKYPDSTSYSAFFPWTQFDSIPWDEINTVIHLAGKAHDTKNTSEEQVYFDINTGLTQKVFDQFLQSKAKQFIFFSSVKAAANSVEGDFLTEEVVPNPIGPYGKSKIEAEKYIQSKDWGNKQVYILRPCMIHGPGNKGNLNLLYDVVRKGIPYPLGAFDNSRSFLNIWNLSWLLEQLISKSPESGVYHLADDQPISTNDLIRLIAQSQNKRAKIWTWNPSVIKSLAKIGDVFKLPFNSERLQKLTENYVVSNQKIKTALNISQLPLDVIAGLERTLKTYVG